MTPERRRRLLFAICLVMGLGALAAWILGEAGRDSPRSVSTAEASVAGGEAAPGQAAASNAPVEALPLPPLEAPLAEVLPELERRAQAGDRSAACRLAAELQQCSWLQMQRESHLNWLNERQQSLERLAGRDDPEAVAAFRKQFEQQAAERERGLDTNEARCAGVSPPTQAELIRRWHQAARAGSRVAMRHWSSGHAFQWHGILDASDQLPIYRREAAAMAWQLVREGDLAMTLHMAGSTAPVFSRSFSLLGQVVEEDPALSLALYQRVLQVLESLEVAEAPYALPLADQIRRRVDLVEQLMTPEQRVEAERHRLEQQAWTPPDRQTLSPFMRVRGMTVPATPTQCHAEAGEVVPTPTAVGRRLARPL